ncbi:MFS transporter [Streptacidiphilus neutrinimicus]|uniref:MFS transporter n=1 Tax=Streptacidiphilus neutrinimicus TaxID=105420 RepID=UPI000694B153|nr:MFS transporter [Streptacidiphilus neutrinimicus]
MPTIPASHGRTGGGKPALTMVAALLGLFIALLDVTVVTVALPTIGSDLNASFTDLEWVANAYMLALAVFIVTAGRLGDLYGQRRVYLAGVTIFLIGSLGCGLAPHLDLGVQHITVLHGARVVQGVGGAAILPLTLAIIYSSFEGRLRALGVMLWGAVGGLATALGPLIGGFLVQEVGWTWIFLVNLPIGVVVVVAALVGMPARRRHRDTRGTPMDLPGLLTASAALLCLNLALINGSTWGWTSGRVVGLLVGAAVAVGVFLAVESRSAAPIMNVGWFRRPSFGGSVVAGFLLGAGMFSAIFYLSIYLQSGLGLSALQTGVRLLPLTLVLMVGAPVGARLTARLGTRKSLALAFVLMAGGLALYTVIDPNGEQGSWTRLLPGMILTGLALGIAMPTSSELTVAAAPSDQVGVAASVGTMFRQVGNAVGIAIMGALMSSQVEAAQRAADGMHLAGTLTPHQAAALRQQAITHGMQHGAWYAAAVTLAAALLVLVLVRDLPPTPEAGTSSTDGGDRELRAVPGPAAYGDRPSI